MKWFFDIFDKDLDVYSTYERVALAGDFDAQVGDKPFYIFLYQHEVSSLNKPQLVTKNTNELSYIDHTLKNSPKRFFQERNCWSWTFCLLLISFCSVLVSFCLLLVSFCSLLVAFCSLLVTFCSLLVTFYP